VTAALFSSPVAFVDVETTGGQPGRNRIIDIGIVAATGTHIEKLSRPPFSARDVP